MLENTGTPPRKGLKGWEGTQTLPDIPDSPPHVPCGPPSVKEAVQAPSTLPFLDGHLCPDPNSNHTCASLQPNCGLAGSRLPELFHSFPKEPHCEGLSKEQSHLLLILPPECGLLKVTSQALARVCHFFTCLATVSSLVLSPANLPLFFPQEC